NKDVAGVLAPLLPLGDPVLLTEFPGPRAASAAGLAEIARALGHAAESFTDVAGAWRRWVQMGVGRPLLLVSGSLFLVGEVLRLLHDEGHVRLDPAPDPPVSGARIVAALPPLRARR